MDESARRLLDSVTRSLEGATARSDQQDAQTCCEAAARRATIDTPTHLPDDVWEPLIRHAAKQAVRSVRYGLEYAALCCESPIEELMLLSLAVAAARSGVPALIYEGHPAPFDDRDEELRGLVTIQPQVMVGKYRIDFEVGYHLMLGPQDRNARLKPGDPAEPIPGDLTWHRALVLVECDGHEFHEKTKEQASRDKRRDRDLQVAGFTIFRYSGSDVWRDCIATAEEVVRVAYQRAVASPAAARKSLPPFR